MRFTKRTWLTALAAVGGIAVVIGGVALSQELSTAPALPGPSVVVGPLATSDVPVLAQVPYVQSLFVGQQPGGGHDEALTELAQLDAKLAQEAQQLIEQYAGATDDDGRAKLKDHLAQTIERQFEAQQKLRELEVSRIEARVKKLRDLIDKRNMAKRTIIDKRLDQLIRDAEGLGWNSPGTSAAFAEPVRFDPVQRIYPSAPGGSSSAVRP
ncbi:MAG TPA: hypothetical protein VGX76_18590 [Pirellulales bacterium]|jgi:hypothetical protein|nr:hypothetical protein [Pirellulales bacterium]